MLSGIELDRNSWPGSFAGHLLPKLWKIKLKVDADAFFVPISIDCDDRPTDRLLRLRRPKELTLNDNWNIILNLICSAVTETAEKLHLSFYQLLWRILKHMQMQMQNNSRVCRFFSFLQYLIKLRNRLS